MAKTLSKKQLIACSQNITTYNKSPGAYNKSQESRATASRNITAYNNSPEGKAASSERMTAYNKSLKHRIAASKRMKAYNNSLEGKIILRNNAYKLHNGYVCHHKNGNHFDNNLYNLQIMTFRKHRILHNHLKGDYTQAALEVKTLTEMYQ